MEIHEATTVSQVMEAVASEQAGIWASAAKRLRDIRREADSDAGASVIEIVEAAGGWQGGRREPATVAYYRKQGSVLKALVAAGEVTEVEFTRIARAAGYKRAGYGQFYRKDGLCMKNADGKVRLREKGRKRLAYAEKYLADHGVPPLQAAV